VDLSGISPGPSNEIQKLTITAESDNPSLITNLSVNFDGSGKAATLNYTVSESETGTATVTITVKDDGKMELDGVDTVIRQFTITVVAPPQEELPVGGENQPPASTEISDPPKKDPAG
jgi:hypothetical protein